MSINTNGLNDLKDFFNEFKHKQITRNNYPTQAKKNDTIIQSALNTCDYLYKDIQQKRKELELENESLKEQGWDNKNLKENPLYNKVNLLRTISTDQSESLAYINLCLVILSKMQDEGSIIIQQINNSEIFTSVSEQIKNLFSNYKEFYDKGLQKIENELEKTKNQTDENKYKITELKFSLDTLNNYKKEPKNTQPIETNSEKEPIKQKEKSVVLSNADFESKKEYYLSKMQELRDNDDLDNKSFGRLKGNLKSQKINKNQEQIILNDMDSFFKANIKNNEYDENIDISDIF